MYVMRAFKHFHLSLAGLLYVAVTVLSVSAVPSYVLLPEAAVSVTCLLLAVIVSVPRLSVTV